MLERFRGHRAFVIALLGMLLAFALSAYLKDSSPFVVVAPIAVGGKWLENVVEKRNLTSDDRLSPQYGGE